MDVNSHNNATMLQNSIINNQIPEEDFISNTYINCENFHKKNQNDEISLKKRREKQQIQWENEIKQSYEWRETEYRKNRWLQRREREKQEEFYYELEEEGEEELKKLIQEEDEQRQRKEKWEQEHLKIFLAVEEFEQDYHEHLKQIEYVEQIEEEENCQRQDALAKQMEHWENLEQREHTAQLQFIEWSERFSKQTQPPPPEQSIEKTQSDKTVLRTENSELIQNKIPIFHRKQAMINQLDLTTNTIIKLIEQYSTPFHVLLRRSVMENNYDDKDEEEEDDDDEDNDFNDYANEEEKDWITIIDDDNFLEQQQQKQRPFICIEKHKYIRTIQRELKRKTYLLLQVYNGNTFYLCKRNEMEQKVFEHMARTNAYVLKTDCSDTTSLRFFVQSDLDTMKGRVTTLFEHLHHTNSLNMIQIEQMSIKESKVQIDYLTFQPDICQQDVPFRPIITCDLGPTINISRHIQRLLQPIYDQAAKSITFFRSVDAIDAIELYAQKGYLQSDTLFVTLHINDLCTLFPHEQTIEALEKFLHTYLPEQEIQGITIETLLQLVRLVFENQLFLYNNCLYQQTKGNGSGSPLTILLADIYMFYWQQDLVNSLMNKNEIFGRCLDEIFMTWNGSINEFRTLLNTTIIKQHLPSDAVIVSFDKNISYLDTEIGHIDGHLQTKVRHNLRIQPYSLPHISNPLLSNDDVSNLTNIAHEALIRAARCCPNIVDFEREQYFIHWSLDLNDDLSLHKFHNISQKIHRFFFQFNKQELYFDRNNYDDLRRRVRQYDQNRVNMEIERRKYEQKQEIWYIVYPFKSKLLTQVEQTFKCFWQRCCNYDNESYLNKFKLKFIRRSNYPSKTK